MLVIVWSITLVLLWLTARLARTPWGRVLRAIREDEDATASLGKNVFSYRLQALALGAALAGLAGLFYAWQFSFFSPDDFQPLITFFGWMILILGGVGRVWAVPVGAVVFGFLFAGDAVLRLRALLLSRLGRSCVRPADGHRAGDHRARPLWPQGLLGRREEMVLE